MQLIIVNPNVNYAGKVVPRDRVPIKTFSPDPNVNYAGKTLPRDQQIPNPFRDTVNTPSLLTIGGIQLPNDSMITPIEGKKVLVMTAILDGPPAFERITTHATKIIIECTLRMQIQGGTTYRDTNKSPSGVSGPISNVFAQEYLHDVWFNVFRPNSLLQVKNSLLNNLNITELIIEECHVAVVRGSTNIPVTIHAWENVPGQSLIIQ